jgi:hypothetical protein
MAKKKTVVKESAQTQQGLGVGATDVSFEAFENLPQADYSDIPEYAEELWFTWIAPARVFRPRLSPVYVRNLILLLVLIVLLLIFVNGLALLIVVLSVVFLMYVLANVPPLKTRHTITNYGIYTHEKFYSWATMGRRFWWEEDSGQKYVVVETQVFPYRLVMLVGHPDNEPLMQNALAQALVFQKPKADGVDKFISWVRNTFPLE